MFQPELSLGGDACLLDLEHARVHALARQFSGPERFGVLGLDLGAHLVEGGDVLADRLGKGAHGRVELLLHPCLVELRKKLLPLCQLSL